MAIDVTRVKRTRGGHEVRIYATDGGKNGKKIHGAVKDTADQFWQACVWNQDGAAGFSTQYHPYDLVEEPRTVEIDIWLNVYADHSGAVWDTRKEADFSAAKDRIACINIKRTVTEGEGL